MGYDVAEYQQIAGDAYDLLGVEPDVNRELWVWHSLASLGSLHMAVNNVSRCVNDMRMGRGATPDASELYAEQVVFRDLESSVSNAERLRRLMPLLQRVLKKMAGFADDREMDAVGEVLWIAGWMFVVVFEISICTIRAYRVGAYGPILHQRELLLALQNIATRERVHSYAGMVSWVAEKRLVALSSDRWWKVLMPFKSTDLGDVRVFASFVLGTEWDAVVSKVREDLVVIERPGVSNKTRPWVLTLGVFSGETCASVLHLKQARQTGYVQRFCGVVSECLRDSAAKFDMLDLMIYLNQVAFNMASADLSVNERVISYLKRNKERRLQFVRAAAEFMYPDYRVEPHTNSVSVAYVFHPNGTVWSFTVHFRDQSVQVKRKVVSKPLVVADPLYQDDEDLAEGLRRGVFDAPIGNEDARRPVDALWRLVSGAMQGYY
jgi:hypothetical protein